MSLSQCREELLRRLASMPFLDRLEMVAVSGWSRGSVYVGLDRLEAEGLAASVPHATDSSPLPGVSISKQPGCNAWPGTRG